MDSYKCIKLLCDAVVAGDYDHAHYLAADLQRNSGAVLEYAEYVFLSGMVSLSRLPTGLIRLQFLRRKEEDEEETDPPTADLTKTYYNRDDLVHDLVAINKGDLERVKP